MSSNHGNDSNHNRNHADKPLGTSFDETASKHWTLDIQKMLKHKKFDDTPVCIHKVRHAIRAIKPEAYTPQYIGLGPYHHWREELVGVDAYKLHASKHFCHSHNTAHKELDGLAKSFEEEYVPRIRASYDRYLKEDDYSLAWQMVIDGIFLLQFLQEHLHKYKSCLASMKRTYHLVDRTETAYHSILQDIMMFENQIPKFVLDPLLPHCGLAGNGNTVLNMLLDTCKNLCPFEKRYNESNLLRDDGVTDHLLAILYHLIVPPDELNHLSHGDECLGDDNTMNKPMDNKTQHKLQIRNGCKHFIKALPAIKFEMLLTSMKSVLPRSANIKPLRFICRLLPFIEKLLLIKRQGGSSSGNPNDSSGSLNNEREKDAPQVGEIDIPSVSKLLNVGIELHHLPYDDPITRIHFNTMTKTLYLPVIKIDANTEVIIRNLVAYEAEAISGPLVLARYTEFMNGIINTAKDVEHLRDKGIIKASFMKTDEDVAQLWNGMSRSIKLSYVQSMDQAIKDVNKFFNMKKRVRFVKVSKECLFCVWKILMLLLALVLMVLWTIQSFCEVYNCPRALGPVTAPEPPVP